MVDHLEITDFLKEEKAREHKVCSSLTPLFTGKLCLSALYYLLQWYFTVTPYSSIFH